MKARGTAAITIGVFSLLAISGSGARVAALSTAFTYQGEIQQNGTPVTGTCDFRFRLYDALTGGTQIQASSFATGLSVADGNFSATVDFGSSAVAFPGADRWLEIAVKCPAGVGTYTVLSPREQLTATPHAFYADKASDVACSGCVGQGDLADDALGSLQGSSSSSLISVTNNGTGSAVTAITHQGPSGVAAANFRLDGYGVFGTVYSGASSVGVRGLSIGPGYGGSFESTSGVGLHAEGGSNALPDIVLGGSSGEDDGVISSDPAYNGSDIYLVSNDAVIVDLDDNNDEQGQFQIRDSAKNLLLDLTETTGMATNIGDANAIYATNDSDSHTTIVAKNLGSFDYYRAVNGSGSTVFKVTHSGRVVTTALQITGGGDLGEKFHVDEPTTAEPGTLMIIDDNNPGKLKRSERAYDTRVAGVVSGARGVNPGVTLEQEGVLDGDVTVAIAGRVYVKADASSTPIKPGDLLTSSARPGTAMKASDPALSQGTIIGKAMSGLAEGTGLVLVLVNLQ